MRISSEKASELRRPTAESSEPAGAAASPPSQSGFAKALEALGNRLDRGEAQIDRATSRDLGGVEPGELIALQAGIYRYVEAVDLAAKLVDRAGNSVKTVLQGSH